MKVLSGVPSGISTSPVLCTLPTSENTLVPELLALPVSLNHAGSFAHDGHDVVPGFNIIDVGRLAPESLLRGERRPGPGPSGLIFQRGDERGLLAAYEGAGALHDFDVELETAAENVVAQQTVFPCLIDGPVDAMHRQRILRAHVNDALSGAHHIAADDHAFQQRVRIALDLVAVHVSAGIAFVGVADDVFLVGLGLGQEVPFVPGQESGAAAAAQASPP